MSKRYRRLPRADSYDLFLEQIADEHEIEENPATRPKWQALVAIPRMPKLCGSMQALLACVLDLTHEVWGFAPISRKRLQDWTGRSRWALDRATAKAKKQGLINTIERRIS